MRALPAALVLVCLAVDSSAQDAGLHPQQAYARRVAAAIGEPDPEGLRELVRRSPARARTLFHDWLRQATAGGTLEAGALGGARELAAVLEAAAGSSAEQEALRRLDARGVEEHAARREVEALFIAALDSANRRELIGAEAHLEHSLARAEALADPWLLERSLRMLGMVRIDGGEGARAEGALLRALAVAGEAGLLLERNETLRLLGDLEFRAGRYAAALERYEAARTGAAAVGDPSPIAAADLAALHSNLGRYDEARSLLELAFAEARASGDLRREAYLLGVQAGLESHRARYGEALRLGRRAIEAWREVSDAEGEASAWVQLAGFHSEVGAMADAEEAIALGLELLGPEGDLARRGYAELLLGLVGIDDGRPEAGLGASTRALDFLRRAGHEAGVGDAEQQRGRAFLALGRHEESIAAFRAARMVREGLDDRFGSAFSAVGLGESLEAAGRLDQARVEYLDAMELSGDVESVQAHWRATFGFGRCLEERDSEARVLEVYEEAVEAVEEMRRLLGAPTLRLRFLGDKLELYRRAARLSARTGDLERAFRLTQAVQARTLLEVGARRPVEASGAARVASEVAAGAAARLLELESRLSLLELRTAQAAQADLERGTLADLRERLAAARREHRAARLELELADPRGTSLAGLGDEVSLSEARRALEGDEVLVVYLIGPSGCAAWTVGARGERFFELETSEAELEAAIERLLRPFDQLALGRTDVANLRFEAGAAEELFRALVEPLAEELEGARLAWIVSDGCLRRLPFALLVSERERLPVDPARLYAHYAGCRFLIEDLALVSLPAVGLLREATAALPAAAGTGSLVAFADPTGGGAPPLVAAREEVVELCERYGVEPELGERASERRFKDVAPGSRTIHLAVHGVLDDRRPSLSHVALAPGGGEDGRLHAWEVEGMELAANPVVLSACETVGAAGRGEGLLGLSRAFLQAGAQSVVASAWVVDDRASAELMRRFHGALAEGETPPHALQRAQVETLREGGRGSLSYVHPFFWAAFVVVGGR